MYESREPGKEGNIVGVKRFSSNAHHTGSPMNVCQAFVRCHFNLTLAHTVNRCPTCLKTTCSECIESLIRGPHCHNRCHVAW